MCTIATSNLPYPNLFILFTYEFSTDIHACIKHVCNK